MNYRQMQLVLVVVGWSLLAVVAVYLEWTGPAYHSYHCRW
jgi:hypothetical protein